MSNTERAEKAWPLVSAGHDKPRIYAPGRTCARPTCLTRLSVYNPDSYCSNHQPDKALEPNT